MSDADEGDVPYRYKSCVCGCIEENPGAINECPNCRLGWPEHLEDRYPYDAGPPRFYVGAGPDAVQDEVDLELQRLWQPVFDAFAEHEDKVIKAGGAMPGFKLWRAIRGLLEHAPRIKELSAGAALKEATASVGVYETVNHPPHYGGDTTYEVVKVIDAWGLDKDAYLFSAIKYIARMGKKPGIKPIEDLKKAAFYLNRRISLLEKEQAPIFRDPDCEACKALQGDLCATCVHLPPRPK